jgi:hypothetical protein
MLATLPLAQGGPGKAALGQGSNNNDDTPQSSLLLPPPRPQLDPKKSATAFTRPLDPKWP